MTKEEKEKIISTPTIKEYMKEIVLLIDKAKTEEEKEQIRDFHFEQVLNWITNK